MPIANCFVSGIEVSAESGNQIARAWAAKINTNISDITLSFIPVSFQAGQTYAVMIQLYLPDFWSGEETKGVQLELLNAVCAALMIQASHVFIVTHMVTSGHVVENGKIVTW